MFLSPKAMEILKAQKANTSNHVKGGNTLSIKMYFFKEKL